MKKKINRFYEKKDFLVTIDAFKVDVVFFINCSEKEVRERMNKITDNKKVTEELGTSLDDWDNDLSNQGRTISFKKGFLVLIRADKNSFRTTVGVLTHEIVHVIHDLLRWRRIPLTEDTEEVYTYHIEYLLKQALLKLY